MAEYRTILHADMDAFYASIEQRDDPSLRGKPVIVGGQGRRGVVATASYEARRFGVHSAMPGAEARSRCPEGIFVTPRMEVYAEVAGQVREVFESFTPLVEPLSLDEAFLDVSGSRQLFGEGASIAEQIRSQVLERTALTVSVGVATSKYVAKVASDVDKPDGLTVVPPRGERAFLAPLPVARLWGAGKKTQARMAQVGLRTIGDLQRLSRSEAEQLLGEHGGAHFHALALAQDERPVVSERDPKSISHEQTFAEDLADPAEWERVLLQQSEAVGRRLREQGFVAGVVRLKLRFPPFETHTRQQKLSRPTDQDLSIFHTARELLRAGNPNGRPIRLLGVGAADLGGRGAAQQGSLFGAVEDDKSRALTDAIDALRDRFGDDAVQRRV